MAGRRAARDDQGNSRGARGRISRAPSAGSAGGTPQTDPSAGSAGGTPQTSKELGDPHGSSKFIGGGPPLSSRMLGYAACALLTGVGAALHYAHAPHTLVFIASALSLIALAWLISIATEELGAAVGPHLGGILNAAFANAAELIITFFALRAGLVEVVKASITGAILNNLLLVLGLSMAAGGARHGVQKFSADYARVNATMLLIAVTGLFVPAVFAASVGRSDIPDIQHLSDGVSLVFIAIYAISLLFFFANPSRGAGAMVAEERPHWRRSVSLLVLLGTAALIGWMSEIMVGALEPTIRTWGLSEVFAGVILIPILGNLAENFVAVRLAYSGRMEFSLVVAEGSSLQVALFVGPVLVLLSHVTGARLDLVFTDLEVATVALAVLLTSLIALDGESNWLEGAQLLAVFAIVALAFFFHP